VCYVFIATFFRRARRTGRPIVHFD
jgi:hypothetical protein